MRSPVRDGKPLISASAKPLKSTVLFLSGSVQQQPGFEGLRGLGF